MRDLREPEEAAFETIYSTPGESADIREKPALSKPRLLIAAEAPQATESDNQLASRFSQQGRSEKDA